MKMNSFLVHVDEIVKKHAPLKKFTKKDIKLQAKPWISNRIRKLMRVRDKLLNRLRKRSDAETKHLYKQFRNRVAVELKESKTKFFHNYFNINSNNMKLLWTGIRSIISTKNNHANVVNNLKNLNGNLITGSTAMANILNSFFVKVADVLHRVYPGP